MYILCGSSPYWAMTSVCSVWRGMSISVSYKLVLETSDEWSCSAAYEIVPERVKEWTLKSNEIFWPIPFLSKGFAHNASIDPSVCIVTFGVFTEFTHCELKLSGKSTW